MALDSNGHWDGSGVAPNEWFLVLTMHPQFMNHHRVSDVLTQEQAAKLEHHVRVNMYGPRLSEEPIFGDFWSEYADTLFDSDSYFCEHSLIAKGATAFEAYAYLQLLKRDFYQEPPSRQVVADIVFEACHRIFDTCVLWGSSSKPAQDLFDRYEEVSLAIDLLPEPIGIRLGAEKDSA